jgi:hypothetical protein
LVEVVAMARGGSGRAEAAWRERLERSERSGLAIARFCEREGVSPASFYRWRLRIRERDAAAKRSLTSQPRFQSVELKPASIPVFATNQIAIELVGGARIEIRSDNPAVIRAVLAEVIERDLQGSRGSAC